MQFEIPIKPHVKTYLTHPDVFGPEAIQVRKNSYLGRVIIGLLSQYPLDDCDWGEGFKPLPILTGVTLTVACSFPLRTELVTDDNLIRLGHILEDYFENGLISFVKGRMDRLPSLQGSVKRFYEIFQINPEHYDYDAAFKLVRRHQLRSLSTPAKRLQAA